jgi:acetyl esterase/lipase
MDKGTIANSAVRLSQVSTANPESYITRNAPPYFIQHGDADSTIPSQQSKEFAEKLVSVIGEQNVFFEYLHGAKHGDPGVNAVDNVEKVFAFIEKQLK